jgi:ferritin
VSKLIDKLLDQAVAEGDKATEDFLWQFVREQVEEEATASGIVDRIKRMGDSAIFNLDEQYGKRV